MGISCLTGHKPVFDSVKKKTICGKCGIDLKQKSEEELEAIRAQVNGKNNPEPEVEEEDGDEYDEVEEEEDEPEPKPAPRLKKARPATQPQEIAPVDILTAAINHWGSATQAVKLLEEMNELGHAVTRALLGNEDSEAIAEEIADVEIMLAQMKLAYQNHAEVDKFIKEKLARTLKRIQKEEAAEKAAPVQGDDDD